MFLSSCIGIHCIQNYELANLSTGSKVSPEKWKMSTLNIKIEYEERNEFCGGGDILLNLHDC